MRNDITGIFAISLQQLQQRAEIENDGNSIRQKSVRRRFE